MQKIKGKREIWLIGLVMLGVVLCLPEFATATPTTNLLITDSSNCRVLEVAPDHSTVWQYGQAGVAGTGTNQLSYPKEAVRLTNGNVLIADNLRVIEVQPTGTSGGTIVWEYAGPGGNFWPEDVKKIPNGNVLITERTSNRVLEVTPIPPATATIVWKSDGVSLNYPWEAEKRGTNTYLIVDMDNHRVIEVQASGASGGNIIWQYGQTGVPGTGTNQLYNPRDAIRLICNTILITDEINSRIIEVIPDYTTGTGGTIVWECSPATGLSLQQPYEAIRMSNWNTLIVDEVKHRIIEVQTSDYPNFTPASIVWQQGQTGVPGTGTNQLRYPYDVEELGIVNIAKAEYEDVNQRKMLTKFAGVVVPIIPPTVNLPEIELSKMVYPGGPQQIGATLTYTINYVNVGSGVAKNVKITDMVPEGTEYIPGTAHDISGPSATEGYSHDGGLNFNGLESAPVTHVRWEIPEVAGGGAGGGTLEFQVVIK